VLIEGALMAVILRQVFNSFSNSPSTTTNQNNNFTGLQIPLAH
jgi:hypothetical protein